METVTDIQAKLAELVAAMVEKGVVTPSADITLRGLGGCYITFWSSIDKPAFDGKYLFHTRDDTPAEVFTAAAEYIAALPSPEEAVTRTYLRKVAEAVDYAKENGVDDEYVTPLRGVTCAMTDNLLTDQRAMS